MKISDIVSGIFSNKLVIVKNQSNRVKLLDLAQQQSIGSETSRYKLLRRSLTHNSAWTSYNSNIESIENARLNLYMDYELMDSDSILSSALDIYADECTSSSTGPLLTISTPNEKIKTVLYNLFYDVLNVEFNLWYWVRSLCKNGDFMLALNLQDDIGVVEVIPIHPSMLRRVEDEDEVYFTYQGIGLTMGNSKNHFKNHEIAHFRLLSDTAYLPYGKSMIEGAKKDWKKLSLMEDAMLIHRIMRAPSKRIFKIDVGNIHPDEVDNHMEEIINQNKKIPYVDPLTGQYNLEYNIQNLSEDYYFPVRGDKSGTNIDTLDGLGNEGSIDDIEYVRKKMMMHLKIPKAYLGDESEAEGKSLLAAEDVRFARTINRIQNVVIGELYKISYIHLMAQGFSKSDLIEFELSLTNPSLIYERQKTELLKEKIDLITSMKELNLFSRKYIYENILNINENEWKDIQDDVIQDLKRGFREQQIIDEGNDPAATGKSFGTPHDLASMYVDQNMKDDSTESTIKKLYTPDERNDNEGRPKEINKFNTRKDDINGRDPLGQKQLKPEAFDKNKYIEKLFDSMGRENNNLYNMLNEDNLTNI